MLLNLKAKPLEWVKEGKDSWIAYNGGDGPFQIDYLPDESVEGECYFAQRNSFEDCEGGTFSTLEYAKKYCQQLQDRDVKHFLNFVEEEEEKEYTKIDIKEISVSGEYYEFYIGGVKKDYDACIRIKKHEVIQLFADAEKRYHKTLWSRNITDYKEHY